MTSSCQNNGTVLVQLSRGEEKNSSGHRRTARDAEQSYSLASVSLSSPNRSSSTGRGKGKAMGVTHCPDGWLGVLCSAHVTAFIK